MSTPQTTDLTFTPWQGLQIWPAYVEVDFAVNGSKVCRGMVRDFPNYSTRRITNLSTGMEFFADADTVFDIFYVTKWPVRKDSPAVSQVLNRFKELPENQYLSTSTLERLAIEAVQTVRIADINLALDV